ncbi:MAG TPA: hypothetical protein VF337_09815 [Candidatus Limnocylindrales bacterium]
MTRSIPALALAVSLLVAACGGSTASSALGGGQSAAPTSAPASVLPSAGAPGKSPNGTGNGTALCAFLVSETPALQAAGSTGGAISVLAIDYANWIAVDSSRVLPDASAMDTLTKASCPDTRTTILQLIGAESFANGF